LRWPAPSPPLATSETPRRGIITAATALAMTMAAVYLDEGGYVNDKTDRGGETNYGISKRAYPNLDIRSLTPELAGTIYKNDYWTPAGCDLLPPDMALIVFDTAVNCGVSRAVGWLHLFPIPEDYLWNRLAYYRGLAQQKGFKLLKFLPGWVHRLELLRTAAPTMTPEDDNG